MKAIPFSLILAGMAFLGAPASAQKLSEAPPASRQTHLVLPLTNSAGSEEYRLLGTAIADLLTVCLSRSPDLIVVDRERLEDVLAEHRLSLSGHADKDQALVRKHLTGVTMLHTGSFTVKNGLLVVLLRTVDVETSAVVFSLEEKGLVGEMDRVCERFAARITKTLPSGPVWHPLSAVDTSPKANVHFARGLGFFWGGESSMAVCEFLRTLSLKADHEQARFWLGRSYFADGHWLDARFEFDKFVKERPQHPLAREAGQFSQRCERKMDVSERAILEELANFPTQRVNLRYWDWDE
jgi:TolB-like protein